MMCACRSWTTKLKLGDWSNTYENSTCDIDRVNLVRHNGSVVVFALPVLPNANGHSDAYSQANANAHAETHAIANRNMDTYDYAISQPNSQGYTHPYGHAYSVNHTHPNHFPIVHSDGITIRVSYLYTQPIAFAIADTWPANRPDQPRQ